MKRVSALSSVLSLLHRAARPALIGAAALAVLGAVSVGAQVPPKVEKTGDLEVVVRVSDGKSLKKASVYAKSKQAEVGDAGKAVRLSGVPAGRIAVTVEAQVSMGFLKGAKRYLGVVDTVVPPNGVQNVEVSVAPVEIIDDYCLGCHPDASAPDYKPQPGLLIRDIHVSGREFPAQKRGMQLSRIGEYNERMKRLEREGKPHNLPLPLEERIVIVAGKEVKKIFYTCESCHTLHQRTPGGDYARAPFREKSDLCRICHI